MSYDEVMALLRAVTWETTMLGILLIDAAETYGFETVFMAAHAAAAGDPRQLAAVGVIGASATQARAAKAALTRAWLGRSLSLTLAAITKAKGRA